MRYRYSLWYPSPNDPAALETWLEEQARRGWRLVRLRSTAKLERREPAALRYHLEPACQGEMPRAELLEGFSHAGWRYLCTLRSSFHLFVSDAPHPAEPHTDPAAEAWAFRKLEHNRAVDFTLLLILWGLLGLYRWKESRFSLLRFLELDSVSQLLWLLLQIAWIGCLLGGTAADWLRLRRQRKRLEAGEALPRHKNWRKQRGLWLGGILAFLVLVGSSAVHAGLRPESWREVPEEFIPIPSLTALAGREMEIQSGTRILESLFLTEVSVRQTEEGSGESLSCRYLSLRPGFLGDMVWRGELRQLRRNVLDSDLDIRQSGGEWEHLALARDLLGRQYLLAQRGGLCVLAQYDGTGDLAGCLPGLAEAAELWKEAER